MLDSSISFVTLYWDILKIFDTILHLVYHREFWYGKIIPSNPLLFVWVKPWISLLNYLLPSVQPGLHERHHFIHLHASIEKKNHAVSLPMFHLFFFSLSLCVFCLIIKAAFLINTEKWEFVNKCMYVDVNLIQLVSKSIWTLKPRLCMNVCIDKQSLFWEKNKGVVHPRMKSLTCLWLRISFLFWV